MRPVYGPPPWRLGGRAFSVWCHLADPGAARAHVPDLFDMDDDPVVRLRFWDLVHDAGFGPALPGDEPAMASVREAVVAFPVRHGTVAADLPAFMYADDPIYTAFGREVMGWPLRDGQVHMTTPWAVEGLQAGTRLRGLLERHGHSLLDVDMTLTGVVREAGPSVPPPAWFAIKQIPDFDGVTPAIHQLALTGPSAFQRGWIHEATATIAVPSDAGSELSWLQPRDVVAAELWTEVDLHLGAGRPVEDLRVAS